MAWPAVALNALQTVNSLLDTNFVQHLNKAALTAIGAALTTVFLLYSMSMAIGVAATALVSRAFGAGDEEGFKEANRKCLGFSVIAGLIITALAIIFAPSLADFMVPKDAKLAATYMHQYLGIVAWMMPAIFVIQSLAGSLRGIGDTKSPMWISGLQIILHIILNFILIFPTRNIGTITIPGFNLGLNGAAWAMTISAWISALIYLGFCTKTALGMVWKIQIPDFSWVQRIFRLAAPASLMSIVRVTSLMAFFYILGQLPNGDIAVGAVRPGFSIEALAFMPSFGLAIAASALVGQSLGANDPDRAARLGWMAGHMAGAVSFVASIFTFVFAEQLAGLLLPNKPEFAAMTASYLRYVSVTEFLFGYGMVLISAQQGAGDTKSPFWLTLICMWILRVPLAAFLALPAIQIQLAERTIPILSSGLNLGADGCWLALAITQAIQGLAAMWLWNKGNWKLARV